MTVLTIADRIKLGTKGAHRVYKGDTLIWEYITYLNLANGTVSTPHTSDMYIDGGIRITYRVKLDSIGDGFPSIISKAQYIREYLIYFYKPSYGMYFTTSDVTNTVWPQSTIAEPVPSGEHIFGVEAFPGDLFMVAIVDKARSTQPTSHGWGFLPEASDVTVGSTGLVGRLYWAQLEFINRAKLVFPGQTGNYLSAAHKLAASSQLEIIVRVSANWQAWSAGADEIEGIVGFGASVHGLRRIWDRIQFYVNLGSGSILSESVTSWGTGMVWIRATATAGGGQITLEWAPDSPSVPTIWTSMQPPTILADAQLSAVPVDTVLGYDEKPTRFFKGRIARTIIRNSIGATTPVLDVNENDAGRMETPTTFKATTGQIVTVNKSTETEPYLNPIVGTVTTPDPGILLDQCVWVFKTRGPVAQSFIISQRQSDANFAYAIKRAANGHFYVEVGKTAGGVDNVDVFGPAITGNDEYLALSQQFMPTRSFRVWTSSNGVTWIPQAENNSTGYAPRDTSEIVRIGAKYNSTEIFNGRIYSVELRSGLNPASGNVIWKFDAKDYPGTGTIYTDPRGRTWTLTNANAVVPIAAPIVQPQPDKLVWKFDAKDYLMRKSYLNPVVGTVTTPDPGPPPVEFLLVFTIIGPAGGAGWKTLAHQWSPNNAWLVYRDAGSGNLVLYLSFTGSGGNPEGLGAAPIDPAIPQTFAVAVSNAGTRWVYQKVDNIWLLVFGPTTGPAGTVFDASGPVQVGGAEFDGRIYSMELRTGLNPAAGTVIWKFDANEYPGTGTVYTDPRGRTWTLTNAAAIVKPTTSYIDPRGRVWNLTNAGAITTP